MVRNNEICFKMWMYVGGSFLLKIFFFAFSLLYAFLESWFRVDVNNKGDLTFFFYSMQYQVSLRS